MRFRRAHLAALVVLAVLFAAGPGAALFALPLVAIFALLASGRYVGEERLIALHVRAALRSRRAPAPRWRPARPAPHRSLFARAPRTFRGPPSFAAAA
ncbi:hypothetical protein DVA67_025665 [Solirubrobacter sp. CPCC 204708]|uniref:Uncharacterized protein n=1 Tax=Solirubrobacter deserti TaxID=2282478 RepID=A0ABT4RRK5_9ACTN|nr:hypothetical protein [Solirubrobacter deserti]MBE2319389.1 hypothetical protein [Solirubrobacter deserti]MDA0140886.1 hypothetical protein [Solirubrobacter deserti]